MKLKVTLEEIVKLHNEIIKVSGGDLGLQTESNKSFICIRLY
jgi:hypothetical protein